MWTYFQSNGEMRRNDGTLLFRGYAGKGPHKNNPMSESILNLGPLPKGIYTMSAPVDTQTHGPCVIWLTPDPRNNMLGRSGFGIHDDSVVHPGAASEGCIVALANPYLNRWVSALQRRQMMWDSGDHQLEVVA